MTTHSEPHVHIASVRLYLGIFFGLVALTILTVVVSFVHLGPLNLAVALVIASAKASLVVLFFMHLKDDSRFNALIFVGSLLFVGLFFVYTMNDTERRAETDWAHGGYVDPSTGERAPGGRTLKETVSEKPRGAKDPQDAEDPQDIGQAAGAAVPRPEDEESGVEPKANDDNAATGRMGRDGAPSNVQQTQQSAPDTTKRNSSTATRSQTQGKAPVQAEDSDAEAPSPQVQPEDVGSEGKSNILPSTKEKRRP